MLSALDHFDALTKIGLKVIPLRENSKIPLCKGWTHGWNRETSRAKLVQFPEANIGLLLGDILDVEGDSEAANRFLIDLIGDYPHPQYTSTKSIHHLFINPDLSLRHFRCGQVEFRGFGHQSVLPPSKHQGTKYQWLKGLAFPIPVMPPKLFAFYQNKKGKVTQFIPNGRVGVYCEICKNKESIHKTRFQAENELFKILGSKWTCHSCREHDLRPLCRFLKSGWTSDQIRSEAEKNRKLSATSTTLM